MKLGNKQINISILLVSCLIFIFRLPTPTSTFAYEIPKCSGFVNDYAKVLSIPTQTNLEKQLKTEAEKEDGVEIAVVTLDSLNGESIEGVSQQIFDSCKIGKKDVDNGILLLLAIKEREIRITTGYSSEVFLTDAEAGRIIRDTIVPSLQAGNYDGAISAGVQKIIEASEKVNQSDLKATVGTDTSADEKITKFLSLNFLSTLPFLIMIFGSIVTYVISFLGRSKSWWAGGIIGAFIGFIFKSFAIAGVLASLGLLLDYILSKNYKQWKLEHKTVAWRRTYGGFRSSTGSGSGISFGGGRSGGGGASGKW